MMLATRKTGLWPLALAVALTLTATACGGGSDANGTANTAQTTLRVAVPILPLTLDPGQNVQQEPFQIFGLAAGTLTRIGDGGKVSLELAESIEGGNTNYTVKLKPGLKYSDGTPLTSQDVVATLEHVVADKTNTFNSYFASIQKITAVDDRTVDFNLKEAFPEFRTVLGFPAATIIPAKLLESRGKTLYDTPLPTAGQFKIESSTKTRVTLTQNPYYAGVKPSTKTLQFDLVTDPAARIAQLQGGQVDVATSIPPKTAAGLSGAVKAYSATHYNGGMFLQMNNRPNSVLSDVRIRKAIAMAVDRNQLGTIAFAGQAPPLLSFWPPSSSFSQPISYLKAGAQVAGAKQMLVGTKCANGCKLDLIEYNSNDMYIDSANVVQQNLKAIGIDARIQLMAGDTAIQRAANGDFDLFVNDTGGWTPYEYASWVLGPAVKGWRTGYASPEMYGLIAEMGKADSTQLAGIVQQINTLFEEDLPDAPLVPRVSTWAAKVPPAKFGLESTFFLHVG